jgi:phosphatidylinositol-3-phosphatase
MKRQHVRALLLVLGLLLPLPLLAWDATGHELTAAIAWDNMTSPAQQRAIAILSAASKDTCLPELFSKDASRPLAERQREFFMAAATWPDLIRGGPCKPLSHKPWHFTDHFWQGVSGGSGAQAPKAVTTLHAGAENAVERLTRFRPVVICAAAPCATADTRAMDLAWILHLVGDIHQPLHSASRVTPANREGDGGGNGFLLGPDETPLHTYWDRIIDTALPKQNGESPRAYMQRVEAQIVHDHPRATMAGNIKSGDFAAWSADGFAAAEENVYPATLHEHQAPTTVYQQMAFMKADEAVALGGYRLADLLNAIGGPAALAAHAVLPHLPAPSHIVIVIDENKKFDDVIGPNKAPYINELAGRGALLNLFASHHPSQPNYMEFFAGDNLDVCADECPIGPFTTQNLGAALVGAGQSFVGFAENLPATGARSTCSGLFRAKHCPWVDFSNVPSSASRSFAQFPTTPAGFQNLPAVSIVIPNMVDDMHNGSGIASQVSAGNAWLKSHLKDYADWAEHNNSLLIVTWDEDSSSYTTHCPDNPITTTPPQNHIATIIMGEPVIAGKKPPDSYTHHDLLRTILDMYGIAPFAEAATAKDITGIWK